LASTGKMSLDIMSTILMTPVECKKVRAAQEKNKLQD